MADRYEELKEKALSFRNKRDWQQYHSPKNLAEGLSVEAAELLENFLWISPEQSRNLSEEKKARIKPELADIFVFLIYLCEELEVDLFEETVKKIEHNAKKYPLHKAKGSHKKYTDL
ncbi:MAG: nucleotide pyrophosphohydrolase [Sedimentisphaerales bacterium]|nr:nucleotide pyrophosphohydrolase [Sedimentisphaerales bacterium]